MMIRRRNIKKSNNKTATADTPKARAAERQRYIQMGKLIKSLVFTIVLSLISPFVFANYTICKVEGSVIGIKAIAWDRSTLVAKVTDSLNKTHEGKVTLIREYKPYGQDGEKINIFVKYAQPYYGKDAAEYLVFHILNDEFRVIGVTYVFKDNKYHLNSSQGNHKATCLSMSR